MRLKTRLPVVLLNVLVLLVVIASPVAAQWTQIVGARISIVWPQDGSGHQTAVAQSRAINVSVWPTGQVACTATPGLQLLMAQDNSPAAAVGGSGQTIQRTVNGVTFPSVEFNDIPANLQADPLTKFRLVSYGNVSSTATSFSGNVWAHAADPRTFYPNPVIPVGFASSPTPAAGLDARIQIVWPHDLYGNFAPVQVASRVNIGVEVFEHGTLNAVPKNVETGFQFSLGILMSEFNGALHTPSSFTTAQVTYTVGANTFTRFVFNDVPVVPGRQYHFVPTATPTGSSTVSPFASIWTHAPDARTYLPYPQVPPACIP